MARRHPSFNGNGHVAEPTLIVIGIIDNIMGIIQSSGFTHEEWITCGWLTGQFPSCRCEIIRISAIDGRFHQAMFDSQRL